ncbi:MAG: HNH endonuclease signature motif containing protein [Ruminococcus sp.]
MVEFIRKNAKGKFNIEITEMVNKQFNTNFTVGQIKNCKKRYKISSNLTGCFLKGNTPWNKGKKGWYAEGTKKTRFKKGHIPAQHREVGSERITKDGYIEIKVAEPSKWKLKHIWVYEQHYGTVPKNCAVVFLDGNKQNTDISNLKLVTRSELLVMNRYHLLTDNPELNNSITNIAKLIDRTNKAKKRL